MLCLISNNAFYFLWFGLVTDLCVSAQLPLKANIACNLTLPTDSMTMPNTGLQGYRRENGLQSKRATARPHESLMK